MGHVRRSLAVLVLAASVAACRPTAVEPSSSPGATVPTMPPRSFDLRTPGSPAPSATPTPAWRPIELPAPDSGAGWIGLIQAVAAVDGGFAAVGSPVCRPADTPTTCHGSAWTTDASRRAWTRVTEQPALEMQIGEYPQPEPGGLYDVAAGPAGLVAIGHPADEDRSAAWRSTDGRTWERLAVDFGNLDVNAVAAGDLGYVIVGAEFTRTGVGRAAAWFSADGRRWVRASSSPAMDAGPCVETLEKPACGGMLGVAAIPAGFVAVGQVRSGADATTSRPAIWTTPDGLTWTRQPAGLDTEGWLQAVAATGQEITAAGIECRPDCQDGRSGGLLVTSRSGVTWRIVDQPGAEPFVAAAVGGGEAIAVARTDPDAERPIELQLWMHDASGGWRLADGLPAPPAVTAYRYVDVAVGADGSIVIAGSAVSSGEFTFVNFAYTGS